MTQGWPPEVYEAARLAARDVYKQGSWVVEREDLEQEALLYIHSHPDLIGERLEHPGFIRRHVRERLVRHIDAERKKHGKFSGYEEEEGERW